MLPGQGDGRVRAYPLGRAEAPGSKEVGSGVIWTGSGTVAVNASGTGKGTACSLISARKLIEDNDKAGPGSSLDLTYTRGTTYGSARERQIQRFRRPLHSHWDKLG